MNKLNLLHKDVYLVRSISKDSIEFFNECIKDKDLKCCQLITLVLLDIIEVLYLQINRRGIHPLHKIILPGQPELPIKMEEVSKLYNRWMDIKLKVKRDILYSHIDTYTKDLHNVDKDFISIMNSILDLIPEDLNSYLAYGYINHSDPNRLLENNKQRKFNFLNTL